ncbi:hypothetical protein V0R37_17930 [Pollutimonas sp. H1-120]|uniref:hypothetical protein n=1 Tax=Pollutimonas sp. H1-120 TaxID=3148824 RepID=UPI003B52D8D2
MKILYDTAFLSLLLLAFAIQQPTTIAASYGLCGLYALIGLSRVSLTRSQVITFFGIVIFSSLTVLNLNQGAASVFYLFSLPLAIMAARTFANRPHQHVISCLRYTFWLFVTATAIGIALHWEEAEPLGAIFPGVSTNGLPSYLIVLQIAYSITYYLKHNRLPLWPTVATLVVAIFGLGRGSIIIAGLILFSSIFLNALVTESKSERRIFLAIGLAASPVAIFALFTYYTEIIAYFDLAIEGSKFSGGIIDEHRARMMTDYLHKIDVYTLIFGANYNGTSIAAIYGGNPHNSFIRLHSFYGLAGFMLVFLSLVLIVASTKRLKHKTITLLFIIFSLLRAVTEPIFFPSPLDFFYILYLVVFFNFAERRDQPHFQNKRYASVPHREAN